LVVSVLKEVREKQWTARVELRYVNNLKICLFHIKVYNVFEIFTERCDSFQPGEEEERNIFVDSACRFSRTSDDEVGIKFHCYVFEINIE
jgi:hypothetical protein